MALSRTISSADRGTAHRAAQSLTGVELYIEAGDCRNRDSNNEDSWQTRARKRVSRIFCNSVVTPKLYIALHANLIGEITQNLHHFFTQYLAIIKLLLCFFWCMYISKNEINNQK